MSDTNSRNVFILLSSRSLPYARICIDTMLRNSLDPVRLRLVVDDQAEETAIAEGLADLAIPEHSRLEVIGKDMVQETLRDRFPGLVGLHQLHDGHPCWRKIIDPIALSGAQDEIIVTDPDLVFPNRYCFEPPMEDGVRMMWQRANCLLPPAAVRRSFDLGVRLSNHVDIGVAQVRAGAIDLEWLDWYARMLDVPDFRKFMHIEAIIWSALAMRMGGEHLNPGVWKCWQRGQLKRVAIALGLPGRWTLKLENLGAMKCIHVSGMSKWWIKEAMETGLVSETQNRLDKPTTGPAYRELTRETYEREQKIKSVARLIGYQQLLRE